MNAIYWWAVQRVKDPERFIADLERPMPGTKGTEYSEEDLARDGESFIAFANAFGVKAPKNGDVGPDSAAAVASPPSA